MAVLDNTNEVRRLIEKRDELDQELREWRKMTRKQLIFKIKSLNLRQKLRVNSDTALVQSIKGSIRKRDGDIESVSFSFARKGIFLEHGVGLGRPVGSASAKKNAKPWLKPILEKEQEALNNILAEKYADIVEAEVVIRIPGIVLKNGTKNG
jgi:hypothetical protein